MIKLRQLISERRSVSVEFKDIKDAISENFRYAFIQGTQNKFLWRGIRKGDPYMYVEPKKHTRVARTSTMDTRLPTGTNNFLNSLIDLVPSWDNWPKRSKSVIFVNSTKSATDYGRLYIVLPYNNAKIAICTASDFFYSFPVFNSRYKGIAAVSQFNNIWTKIFYPENNPDAVDITPEGLKKTLSEYDSNGEDAIRDIMKKLKNLSASSIVGWHYTNQIGSLEKDLKKHYNGNFIEYFDDVINPEKNGFELKNLKEIYDKYTGRDQDFLAQEMFTDSPCVLISRFAWLNKFRS